MIIDIGIINDDIVNAINKLILEVLLTSGNYKGKTRQKNISVETDHEPPKFHWLKLSGIHDCVVDKNNKTSVMECSKSYSNIKGRVTMPIAQYAGYILAILDRK